MIKALFFDLDGTLLDGQKKISPRTYQTLGQCREKGYRLFIATARPPLLDRMLSWDENTLNLFDGGSYQNGGCIAIDGHKEYQSVSREIVDAAINQVKAYDGLNIALQLEDEKHAFRIPLDENGYRGWGITASEIIPLDQTAKLETIKILVFYSNLIDSVRPIDDDLISSLTAICGGNAQIYLTDRGKSIQIMGASVNKFRSIEKIRDRFGYAKDEIAVFGDDVNDVEMLSEYEFSVAMGNAEPDVKSSARYVTLSNDSDGISHAIHNILSLL